MTKAPMPTHTLSAKVALYMRTPHGQKTIIPNFARTVNGHTMSHRGSGSDGYTGASMAVNDNPILYIGFFTDDNRRYCAVMTALIGPDHGQGSDKRRFFR
jgi:hypothetical protein